MATNSKLLLLSYCVALSIGNLVIAPAAQAGYCEDLYPLSGGRRSDLYSDCVKREGDRNFNRQLDGQINNTRVNPGDFRDGLFNTFSKLNLGPSVISGEGGVGYGVQGKIPLTDRIDIRGGINFQSASSSFNIGATYNPLGNSGIRPFVGTGWRSRSYRSDYVGARSDGFYGTAGVDIPIWGPTGATVQANQSFNGGATEIQGTINVFGF
jgi:hypothetical protein